MIHMHAIPASLPHTADQPRMAYLTNTEVDASGKVRAIHSHHDITEIGLVYAGQGFHVIDGHEYRSEPGDLILYNTDMLHQDLALHADAPMRFFLCGISNIRLRSLPLGHIAASPSDYVVSSGPYFDFLLHGFEAIERGLIEQQPQVATFAQGFLQSLCAIVDHLANSSQTMQSHLYPAENSVAEDMRRYIDQNYTQRFTLDELADRFHINRFYAAHLFSDAFNCSPMQYRTRRRIGEAQSLLTSSDFSITYIGSMVGYDDPNRFSQAFSKLVGMPPSKYRDLSVCSQQTLRKTAR